MNDLEFLQNWYVSQCNDDWEHTFGIKIETLDNPGWHIAIDLKDTELENIVFNEISELSDNDWYHIKIKDGQFNAYSDPHKVGLLLKRIREILSNDSSPK